jgi:hypothetical protein
MLVEAAAVEAEAVEAAVAVEVWAEEEATVHILNLIGLLTVHSKVQPQHNNKCSNKDTVIVINLSSSYSNKQLSSQCLLKRRDGQVDSRPPFVAPS